MQLFLGYFAFIFSGLFFNFFQANRWILIFILSYFLFVFFLYDINYTADKAGYIHILAEDDVILDSLIKNMVELGYTFDEIYIIHIVLIGFFLCLFISHFTQNIFFVLSVFTLLQFVPIINQIRFFLAFSLIINGFYYYYIKKNTRISYLFFITGFLSHSSMILFALYPLLDKFTNSENRIQISVISSIIIFLLIFTVFDLVSSLEYFSRFSLYLSGDDMISSYIGGVYSSILHVLIICNIIYIKSKMKSNNVLLQDKTFILLFNLSLFPILFVFSGLKFIIFINRYIHPFIIIWFCFYLYTFKYNSRKTKEFQVNIFLPILALILFYYTYFLPDIVLGEPAQYYIEFVKSYNSIERFSDILIK